MVRGVNPMAEASRVQKKLKCQDHKEAVREVGNLKVCFPGNRVRYHWIPMEILKVQKQEFYALR